MIFNFSEIARVEPTILQRLSSCLRISVIAQHDIVTFCKDLTFIGYPYLASEEDRSHRAVTHIFIPVHSENR